MLSEHNVMVDDVDIGVLAAVVRFIYTGRLTVSRDNVKQIKTFCKEVNLDEAVKMCQSYTDNILSQSEVVTVIKEENAGTISVHGNGISESLSPRRQAAPRGNDKKGSKRKRTCAVTENNVDDLEKRKQSLDNILAQSLNVSTSNISLNTTKASLSKEKSSNDKTVANTCNKRTKCAKVVGKGRKSKTKKLSSVSKLKGRNKTSRSNCDKTSGNSSGFEKCAKGSREGKGDRFSNSGTAEMCLDKTLNVYEDSANEDDCIEFVDDPDSESHVYGYCSTEGTDPLRTNIKPKLRVKKIKDVYPRNCELCNEMLPDLKSVKSHMKLQHKESTGRSRRKCNSDNWPCSVCGRLLTSAVRQACHLYSKHGMPYDSTFKLYACDVEECKYVTASKHYLQIHNKGRHGNERPHVCHYCGKGFKLPSALSTHLNIHTKVLVHKCEECGLTFNQKGGLEVHIKKHHTGEASWTELCHLCSDKFMQKAELCWHMYKTHSIPLPDRYKVCSCDFCDYQTIRKNKMQRHMDAHDEVRNYSCLVCGKKFVTKSYLNRHVRYHGEKSFKCDYDGCTYCCVDRVGLNKHIRLVHTHKNYKPFVCSLCPYKSGLRGNLDKHIRTVHNLEVVTKHTVQLKMKFKDRVSGDIITKDGQYIHKVVDQRGMSHLQCLEMEPADQAVPETYDRDHRLELATADIEKPSTIIAGRPATPLPHDTAPPPPHDLPGYLFSTGQLIQPGTAEPSSQLAGPYTTVGAAGVAPQGDQAVYTNVNPMAFVTNVPKFANYY